MRRYARSEFAAFGVLPALNVIALLIYGLVVSTRGTYGEGETIPALVIIAALHLPLIGVAAVKRGRDFGWKTAAAAAIFVAAMLTIPIGFLPLIYLACARGQADANMHGPPPRGMSLASVLRAAALLAAPWIVLRVLAAVYEL